MFIMILAVYYNTLLAQLKLFSSEEDNEKLDFYMNEDKDIHVNKIIDFCKYIEDNNLFDNLVHRDNDILKITEINDILCSNVDICPIFSNPEISLKSFINLWSHLHMYYLSYEMSKEESNNAIIASLSDKLGIDTSITQQEISNNMSLNELLGKQLNVPDDDFLAYIMEK